MSEKFVTPAQLPDAYERELLVILIEECAEVQHRATKLLRFGRDEVQPGQPDSNAARLSDELGDAIAVAELCIREGLINRGRVGVAVARKKAKLAQFMQTEKS